MVSAVSVLSKMVALNEIPSPKENAHACGRPITVTKSAVCDPHQLLKIDSQNEIEGYINAFITAEVAVVIIEQMDLNSVTTVNIDTGAERYARGLHDRYGVGKKIVNNGILVFLSIKDRAIFISTGTGVQKKLTEPVLDYIIDNMKPDLRKGDYGKAISTCIISLDLALSEKGTSMIEKAYKHDQAKKSSSNNGDNDSGAGFWVVGALFVGIFGCSWISNWHTKNRLNNTERGREKLNRIIKEMESVPEGEANKFSAQSCPICLEDFKSIVSPGESPRDIFADSSQQSAAEDLSKKTVSLRCGHLFCIPCIESYLKSEMNNRCPICRLPIDANTSPHIHPPNPARPSPRRTTASNSFNPFRRRVPAYDYDGYVPNVNANLRENVNGATSTYTATETEYPQETYGSRSFFDRTREYRFRLHRLHYLYPNAMDYELLRQANTALDRGSINDLRAQLEQRGTTLQTLATDIRTRMENAARSSGSGGSSSGSYGGGYSSGGSGGRW